MARTGHNDIQDRMVTLLKADAAFGDSSVTKGDFTCLNNGSPPWAVTVPGGMIQPRGDAYSEYAPALRDYVEVWRPFADGYADLMTAVQAAVDVLNKYPTLNGLAQVKATHVTEVSDLLFLENDISGSDPEYVGARVTLESMLRWSYDGEGEYT